MKNLFTKILKFQNEVKAIKKDQINPYFKSSYVDINGILEEVKPLLSKVGLIILQPISTEGDKMMLRTIIADPESDESIESINVIPSVADIQKQGAAITYYRRYAIQSLLALQAEDDDGNSVIQEEIKSNLVCEKCKVAINKEQHKLSVNESQHGFCMPCLEKYREYIKRQKQ